MNILIFGSYGEIGASDFSGVKNFGGYGSKNGGGGSILEIGATGFSVGGVKISGCYDLKTGGGEAVLEICVTDFSGGRNFGGHGLKTAVSLCSKWARPILATVVVLILLIKFIWRKEFS